MNQEKIGKLIKELRTNNNLSQKKFADNYGVTFQAVSKWENGKSLPDIAILQQICKDYNLDINNFLETKTSHKKSMGLILTVGLIIILIIIVVILMFFKNNENDFEFKTLSTTCDNFNLYGSIAYNDSKTSIYISHITYCGGDDDNNYSKIECSLYEMNNNIKTEISKCENKENISLEEFLKNVSFTVDHYDNTCKIYKKESIQLEINATDNNGKITTYKIPLTLEDNCDN